MEELGKLKFDKDIINSLIFYISLGIVLAFNGAPPELCEKSLNSFIAEGKKNGTFRHHEILGSYLEKAYRKIPAETLRIVGMDTIMTEGIYVVDTNHGWVNKL